jgi:hypothetical protein
VKKLFGGLQIAVIALSCLAYLIDRRGDEGALKSEFLQEALYSPFKALSGTYTNLKFQIRPDRKPKPKIIIVGIDDQSLDRMAQEQHGRWPWSRKIYANLTAQILRAGAKVVAYDFVMAEPEEIVNKDVRKLLEEKGLDTLITELEADRILGELLLKNQKKVVLGWTRNWDCRPSREDCPINDPKLKAHIPKGLSRHALKTSIPDSFDFS